MLSSIDFSLSSNRYNQVSEEKTVFVLIVNLSSRSRSLLQGFSSLFYLKVISFSAEQILLLANNFCQVLVQL